MKKSIYVLIILVLALASCTNKSIPVSDNIHKSNLINSGKNDNTAVKPDEPMDNLSSDATPTDDKQKNHKSDEPENANKNDLKAIADKNFANAGSGVSYGIKLYSTGENITYNSSQMKSASVIKIFIMEYAYSLIEKGELTPDTKIGNSALGNLIESMITVSDNNATNELIDYFTMDKLNSYFKSCGYNDTVLGRRMLDFDAQAKGRDNFTSVNDVMKLLDKIYNSKDKSPGSDMLAVMSRQRVSTKIRRDMPSDVRIANKTGELSDVENDVGIVFTPKGDYAVVFITNGTGSYEAQNAIAKTTKEIYRYIIN